MHQMMEATDSIGSKLAVLSEKAGNINTVVTTINRVADQTNLLSLNAAIEAEKAGEYGVGFAVVATEIRRLADQTAVATWDIEQMVKEMQSAVSAGVMGMEKFSEEVRRGVDDVRQVGAQLAHIIEQVDTLIPRFEEVNEGMTSQSQGAQQIRDAIVQLSESAQQTADSLRQSNGAIMQLNEAAGRLQEGASHFRVSS
jgi:methyl-accepting chemotaxis protein WspA